MCWLYPFNHWLSFPTILPDIPSISYSTSSRFPHPLKVSVLGTHDSLGEYIDYFWRMLFEEFLSSLPLKELDLKEHCNFCSRLGNLQRMLYKLLC
nr:MAG TPA: hypothetical protein [Bacteriophage sp.]